MKKLALSLSVALLALAAPAFASSGEARSVSVKTADLNLSSAAGVELVRRAKAEGGVPGCHLLRRRRAGTRRHARLVVNAAIVPAPCQHSV